MHDGVSPGSVLEHVFAEHALALHPEFLHHALGGAVVGMVIREDSMQPQRLETEAKEQSGSLGCDSLAERRDRPRDAPPT